MGVLSGLLAGHAGEIVRLKVAPLTEVEVTAMYRTPLGQGVFGDVERILSGLELVVSVATLNVSMKGVALVYTVTM